MKLLTMSFKTKANGGRGINRPGSGRPLKLSRWAMLPLCAAALYCDGFSVLTGNTDNFNNGLTGDNLTHLLVPRVVAVTSNVIATYTSGGQTYDLHRVDVVFSRALDQSTITESNFTVRDVNGNSSQATTFSADLEYEPATFTVSLWVEQCVTASPCAGANANEDALNELIVSSSVQAENGEGLRGNAICDENLCPNPNDYRYVLDLANWGGASPPLAVGTDAYTPNDLVYNPWTVANNPGTPTASDITVDLTIDDYDPTGVAGTLNLVQIDGNNADSVTEAAGVISAEFNNLSSNTQYTVTLNPASLNTSYEYADGSKIEKTLFLDRMSQVAGRSDYEHIVWSTYNNAIASGDPLPAVTNVQAGLGYTYVGGEFTGVGNYTAVAFGQGDFISVVDANGNTVAQFVGAGNGDLVNNTAGGNGDSIYNDGFTNVGAGNGHYDEYNRTATVTFNQLMDRSELTPASVRAFYLDGADIIEFSLTDADISFINAGSNTLMTITSPIAGKGIDDLIVSGQIEDANDGLCLDGNDGGGTLDSDGSLQCVMGNVDSNSNGFYDDWFYWNGLVGP